MIVRIFSLLVALLLSGPSFAAGEIKFVYLGLQGDTYYEPQVTYTGLSLKDHQRPVEGVELGLRGTRVLGRALKLKFGYEEILAGTTEDILTAVRSAKDQNVTALLLDLPEEQMEEVLELGITDVLLFNIRHKDKKWRSRHCAPNFLHTMPSRAMLSDAMAQHLRFQNWSRILIMHGETPADIAELEAVEASARKFGLSIDERVSFQLTNDPRRRDLNNVRLMTSGGTYDTVWLIDSTGEFGRYVPYATAQPRPVVGSEGLSARAWHWTLERYGAPQLNQRFRRGAKRDMRSLDWAAWAAVQSVVSAVKESGSGEIDILISTLRSPDIIIDLYKGMRGSFRSWNGQLRQPVLLTTTNAVISIAPLDGFEHQFDRQDTLGIDERESGCAPAGK